MNFYFCDILAATEVSNNWKLINWSWNNQCIKTGMNLGKHLKTPPNLFKHISSGFIIHLSKKVWKTKNGDQGEVPCYVSVGLFLQIFRKYFENLSKVLLWKFASHVFIQITFETLRASFQKVFRFKINFGKKIFLQESHCKMLYLLYVCKGSERYHYITESLLRKHLNCSNQYNQ